MGRAGDLKLLAPGEVVGAIEKRLAQNDQGEAPDALQSEKGLNYLSPFREIPVAQIEYEDSAFDSLAWIGMAGNKVLLAKYDLYD